MSSSTRDGKATRPADVLAATVSVLISTCTLALGVALIAIPSPVIGALLSCLESHEDSNDDPYYMYEYSYHREAPSELDTTLSRLTGAVLASLSLSGYLLAGPALSISGAADATAGARGACRNALTSQAIVGLLIVLVGVIEDITASVDNAALVVQGKRCGKLKVVSLLAGGTVIMLLACIGLMASFWPQSLLQAEDTIITDNGIVSSAAAARTSNTERNSLTEPLLAGDTDIEASRSGMNGGDTECQDEDENSGTSTVAEPITRPSSSTQEDNNPEDEGVTGFASSRITGTRRLIKLAAPEMFYIYLGCVVLLIRLPFSIAQPHFVSTTLGALSRQDYAAAKTEILLLFLMGIIDAALDFWVLFLFGFAKENIVKGVRLDTFRAILRQEVAFFDSNTSGDLTSRLTSDCGEMAGDLSWFFRFSVESIVRICGVVTYMMVRSPTLGLCAVSIVPVVGVINKKYGDWLNKNAKAVQTALAEANSTAQEAFSCIRTVIAFASEDQESEKYGNKIEEYYRLNIKQLYMTGFYYMIISTFLINTCVKAALLYIGTLLIQQGNISAEVLLAFMLYQGSLQNETQNLLNSYTSLIKSSGAGDKVFALLDRRPCPPGTGSSEVVLTTDDSDDSNSRSSGQEENGEVDLSLELRNVAFTYASRPDHRILKDFSLRIPPGSTMAMVGISGSGKSTVISLLERFYDPSNGSVLIGGKDLRYLPLKDYRKRLSIVTQEPLLFSGTILSNILYGCPNASFEDVVHAAKLANAHDFIMSFPDKYDTLVGERGTQLSGGQRQRIVISRAIIKKPSFLLLDEATSALDSQSERIVQEALDHLLQTKNSKSLTTVIIAHRLQTVRNADCIAVIDDGTVVELGAHADLMQQEGSRYRSMVEKSNSRGKLAG